MIMRHMDEKRPSKPAEAAAVAVLLAAVITPAVIGGASDTPNAKMLHDKMLHD